MARSPFQIAFDHFDSCEQGCDYGLRRLCPDGRALFDAAHKACELIVGGADEPAKAQA